MSTERSLPDMRTWILLSLAALVACGSGEGGSGEGTYPTAELAVTVEHPDADTVSYQVSCRDEAASVTGADLDGDTACRALLDAGVRSRLIEGSPRGQACTEIYGGPDVATITGTIAGQEVDARIDRSDGCGISDWDELLAGLLPAALGVS